MWPELPAKRQRHESVVYRIYLFIYLSIYLSLSLSLYLYLYLYISLYLTMYLSIYLSICTGKPEKRSVRVDAARSVHSTNIMVQV